MSHRNLIRQIAKQTGDDLRAIRRLGFSIVNPDDRDFDPPPIYPPQMVDWDALDQLR